MDPEARRRAAALGLEPVERLGLPAVVREGQPAGSESVLRAVAQLPPEHSHLNPHRKPPASIVPGRTEACGHSYACRPRSGLLLLCALATLPDTSAAVTFGLPNSEAPTFSTRQRSSGGIRPMLTGSGLADSLRQFLSIAERILRGYIRVHREVARGRFLAARYRNQDVIKR